VESLGALLLAETVNRSELSSERTEEVLLSSLVTSVDEGGIVMIESCVELQNLKILYTMTCKPWLNG